MKRLTPLQWLMVAVVALLATACASIMRPQGGPRDETPPNFSYSNPGQGATGVTRQRIDLFFDENVQVKEAFNKVIVSPVQKTTPQVSANGKRVTVNLKDSLIPNTTYTIDFADAIQDLNESNPLDGFAMYFSTGDTIDTLRISGMVLDARTLEPAQGMLVGIYSNLSDTAIRTLPMERIARTNQLGQFTIYNLKEGDYRIYALNDVNRDYYWDRTEDVAFYDVTVRPYVQAIEVTDTLRGWNDEDSLATRAGVAYFPNDILLTHFNEGYKAQYLKDYSRPIRRKIMINMAAPSDSLPTLTLVGKDSLPGKPDTDWALRSYNATRDSLEYWITDADVLATDSLYLSVRYQRTDSAGLSWKTDTLKFFYKEPKPKKKDKKEEEADTVAPAPVFIGLKNVTKANHEIYMPLIIENDQPIDTILAEGVHLEIKVDTLWEPIAGVRLDIDSVYPLTRRRMEVDWEYGEKYRLTIDSAAVYNVYGEHNKVFKHEFTVKTPEEYSNLTFTIANVNVPAIVEVLDKSENILATAPVINGTAHVPYLNPATVYARLYLDANDNGRWDTGNLIDSVQPEEVYYYPQKIVLRKNWDVTQTWDIYQTPLDMQKPLDIKKNKPKLKKGEQAPNSTFDDDDEFDDEFGGLNNENYGRSQGNNRSGNRGNNRGGMGGMGGFGGMGGMRGGMGGGRRR